MKLLPSLSFLLLAFQSPILAAASAWGFADATLAVQTKGAGVGSGLKEKLTQGKVLDKAVELGASDTLKLLLTLQDGKAGKKPHQAYLNLEDPSTGLETSFPFSAKDNGKAKIELNPKDIPQQLLNSGTLSSSIIIASFGSSTPYKGKAFNLKIQRDPSAPAVESQVRYGKLPEINHIFRSDPKSPPIIITLFFLIIVLAAFPALLGGWFILGANANHLSRAFEKAPVAHGLFFGSILAMEGVFFLYYTVWNLLTTLPVAIVIGSVIFISGSRALTEVKERRDAGLR